MKFHTIKAQISSNIFGGVHALNSVILKANSTWESITSFPIPQGIWIPPGIFINILALIMRNFFQTYAVIPMF